VCGIEILSNQPKKSRYVRVFAESSQSDSVEGSKLEETKTSTVKNTDNSIDLLKIQIYSERAHTRLTTQVTNTYAIFIGFVVLFYTLFYENVIPLFGFTTGLAIFAAGTVYETYHVRQAFRKDIKKISDMMETVKEGKELPKLEDLVN